MYFTPSEAKQFLIQVQQKLIGIGAQLRDDLDGFTVVHIVEGGPASLANTLKMGDKIIGVNHEPVAGMDIQEAVDLIRGPQGTEVILTVVRTQAASTDTIDVSITREEVILKESRYETRTEPFGDQVIGYLALHSFYQDQRYSSAEDLRQAIRQMEGQHKIAGLILDLRNNSGGLLPQAVEVTSLFIKKGVVAYIKDSNGQHQKLRNLSDQAPFNYPLIVLISKTSASASEIVALALADYGRAIVIGDDTTYGKGSYQTFTLDSNHVEHINPKGEYKVTRGIYYTVGGQSPQLAGVPANIHVPGVFNFLDIGEKYTKYPLNNDHIDPQFEDDLKDVHPLHRMQIRKRLGKNVQTPNTSIHNLIAELREHSEERIAKNTNYQNFLLQIKNTDHYDIDIETVGQNDLQLEEAFNIMKEYVVLLNKKAS